MRKLIFALAVAFTSLLPAQTVDSSTVPKKLYIKANALFLPVGMLNAGVEYQLNKRYTVQAEVFISPWKSFMGKYAQVYMIGFDGRYYFDEAFKHWYVGANISAARIKIQKYNYWGDEPFQYTETSPVYTNSDLYQNGYSLMLGAVVGYQFQLAHNWNIDLFLGAGTVQSFYRGWHKELGIRYDLDPTRDFNRSGEFLPYRGGVMISYRLK
ncbi:DUF3575 domain-containing protein [Kaistella palustris]|uniref:DUF3575 domain-containing protein n=1 Tax=Kaistella palustris TaxID=493376 RepID=UPI0004215215|nr:DUF3575 domain-containing protein [Kaistella palustris]